MYTASEWQYTAFLQAKEGVIEWEIAHTDKKAMCCLGWGEGQGVDQAASE